LHESIRQLPGSTASRQLLLDRAVELLDGLARDAGGDIALKLELAEGYRRLGHVQGSSLSENVGNTAAAVSSFEKAARLGEDVLSSRPGLLDATILLSGALDDLAGAELDRGQIEAAERADRRHLEIAERLARDYPGDGRALVSAASSFSNLAYFRGRRQQYDQATALYERSIALYESLPDAHSSSATMIRHAFALKRLGAIELKDGKIDEAERRYRAALALDERVVAANPTNSSYRYDMTFSLTDLGLIAWKRGEFTTAVDYYSRALSIRQATLEADPRNVRAMRGVSNVRTSLAGLGRAQKRYDEAIDHLTHVIELREQIVAASPDVVSDRTGLAWARIYKAGALMDKAELAPAAAARSEMLREARSLLLRAEPDARRAAVDEAQKQTGPLEELTRELDRLRRLGG
jgi:serine/threonine-protein kinase